MEPSWIRHTPEAQALFAEERLVLAASELVYEALEATGTTKKKLAEKLGVRPTEISQRLSGHRNMTLRSLARMMHVLGYVIELVPTRRSVVDRAEENIGARITMQTEGEAEVDPQRVHRVGFLVGIRSDQLDDPLDLRRHADEALSMLQDLDHIVESSYRYDVRGIRIVLDVEADNHLDAGIRGIIAIRTAIHSAGGGTPGWERIIDEIVRDLRVDVTSNPQGDQSCEI